MAQWFIRHSWKVIDCINCSLSSVNHSCCTALPALAQSFCGVNCCQLLCYSSWTSLFHFAQGWGLLPLSLFGSNSFRRSVITSQSGVGAEARGAMLSWQCGRLPVLWHWPILGYSIVSFSAVENRAFCKTLLHSEQQIPWWKSYCWERMQLWFEDSHNCWRWRLNGLQ